MEKLLQHYNFYLDFPVSFPNHLRYPFILDFWTEEHVPLSFGENHIEFCSYDEENCPFPGYCDTCNEIAGQIRFDEEELKEAEKKMKNKAGSDKPDDSFPGFPF